MLKEKRPLPWSGKRYYFGNMGTFYNSEGIEIEPYERDGHYFVKIDWVLGFREYYLAVLVLYSFELIRLPDYHIDEIIPLYIDKSHTNLSPANLLYKFKSGKIEVENQIGFYYIPFYTDYAINKHGDLKNIKTNKTKVWSYTQPNVEKNQIGEYLYSRLIDDNGCSKVLFQHRALCYVFKSYDFDVFSLVVNHIDGNTKNNKLDNIELVTYQRNNIHAVEIGLRGDNRPIMSRNLETGEIIKFVSINACGRHYGQPRAGFVMHRLKHGAGKVYSDMLQFKYDDGEPWEELNLETLKITRTGKSEDIIARNVFTGNFVIFEGATNGFDLTGVRKATIISHVTVKQVLPINGWNFRWLQDDIVWPVHTERHLRVYEKYPIYPPDGVILVNIETNEERFIESVALACQQLKIQKHILYDHIKNGRTLQKKYKVLLFKLKESLGLPDR